jgi:CheY-like chemotaxis protein
MTTKTLRVIIVEDHADTAEALRRFLTSVGYKVYVAADVSSARALAKAVEFDVLLSDLRLPDGTGWDLMEELTAAGPIRGIAMSGYNTDADIARSLSVGFLYHIAKPLMPDHLSELLQQAAAN